VERTIGIDACRGRDGTLGRSQSLERGLAFSPRSRQPSADRRQRALARLDLSRSTAHRLRRHARQAGYLQQDRLEALPARAKVSTSLLALNSMDLLEISAPYLRQLSDENAADGQLAILDGPDVVYIERCRTPRRASRNRPQLPRGRAAAGLLHGDGQAISRFSRGARREDHRAHRLRAARRTPSPTRRRSGGAPKIRAWASP